MALTDSTRRLVRARPRWARESHPIYHLETSRRASNRALLALRWGCFPAILGVVGLLILIVVGAGLVSGTYLDGDTGTQTILGITSFLLLLVQVTAGAMVNVMVIAQAAPAISGELELQSWRLLRTTTLPVREIILAKLAAVFEHLKLPFYALVVLRMITTITGLLFYGYTLYVEYASPNLLENLTDFVQSGHWIPVSVATIAVIIFFVSQPALQLVFNGTLGMVASVMSTARSRALLSGLVGRLGLWVTSILLNVGAIYGLVRLFDDIILAANYYDFRVRSAFAIWTVSTTICLYAAVVLVGQIGAILGGLRFVEQRARHLGA